MNRDNAVPTLEVGETLAIIAPTKCSNCSFLHVMRFIRPNADLFSCVKQRNSGGSSIAVSSSNAAWQHLRFPPCQWLECSKGSEWCCRNSLPLIRASGRLRSARLCCCCCSSSAVSSFNALPVPFPLLPPSLAPASSSLLQCTVVFSLLLLPAHCPLPTAHCPTASPLTTFKAQFENPLLTAVDACMIHGKTMLSGESDFVLVVPRTRNYKYQKWA